MIDIHIIERAQKGDVQALSSIYKELCTPLFRFVAFRVGRREDAEDIAQDTLLAATQQIQSFRGDAKFINWCYEIAKRKIADYWRQHYKVEMTEWEERIQLSTPPDVEGEDLEELARVDSIETQVKLILDTLPENYRTVLHFRFLKNYTLQETADAMNISLSNAKVLQHRALKKASQLFHDYPL